MNDCRTNDLDGVYPNEYQPNVGCLDKTKNDDHDVDLRVSWTSWAETK
jgi:hypothetical protein